MPSVVKNVPESLPSAKVLSIVLPTNDGAKNAGFASVVKHGDGCRRRVFAI